MHHLQSRILKLIWGVDVHSMYIIWELVLKVMPYLNYRTNHYEPFVEFLPRKHFYTRLTAVLEIVVLNASILWIYAYGHFTKRLCFMCFFSFCRLLLKLSFYSFDFLICIEGCECNPWALRLLFIFRWTYSQLVNI